MSTRRRYDTTALVDKMRQERRRNLLLGVCAAGTLTGLVTFYMLNMRGMTIPEVPADATPHAPAGGIAVPVGSAAPSMGGPVASAPVTQISGPALAPTPTPGPAAAPAPAAPAAPEKPPIASEKPPVTSLVRPNMPSGALIWIDDAGVQRGAPLQLTEGRHALRVKIGKHTIHERFEVKAGETLELRLDSKKRKLVLERHPVASKSR